MAHFGINQLHRKLHLFCYNLKAEENKLSKFSWPHRHSLCNFNKVMIIIINRFFALNLVPTDWLTTWKSVACGF